MKPYFLNSDINVLCVTARSFPDGIMAAFNKLNSLAQEPGSRRVFGISYGDGKKNIIYKARKIRQMKRPGWDVKDSQLKKANILVSI